MNHPLQMAVWRARLAKSEPKPEPLKTIPLEILMEQVHEGFPMQPQVEKSEPENNQSNIQQAKPVLNAKTIISLTANYYKISVINLLSYQRCQSYITPRHVAMYLCSELTGLSLAATGRRFSGRDHSTILHAHKKIAALLRDPSKPKIRQAVEDITSLCRANFIVPYDYYDYPPAKKYNGVPSELIAEIKAALEEFKPVLSPRIISLLDRVVACGE